MSSLLSEVIPFFRIYLSSLQLVLSVKRLPVLRSSVVYAIPIQTLEKGITVGLFGSVRLVRSYG